MARQTPFDAALTGRYIVERERGTTRVCVADDLKHMNNG
jgi:hypothetical protein